MAVFEFAIEGGEVIGIEAPTYAKAVAALDAATGVAQSSAPVTLEGLGKQGAAALGRGTAYAAGIPGTLRDLMQLGLQKSMSKGYELATGDVPDPETQAGGVGGFFERLSAGPSAEVRKQMSEVPLIGHDPNKPGPLSGQQLSGLLGELTGGFTERQPQNVPEEYVRTIGEFLPSAALFGGVNPLSLFAGGVGPALTSETAGQTARKFAPEGRPEWMPDWVPDAETVARIGGAFLSPLGIKGAQKVITPNVTSKTARTRAAKYFEKENIPYTAGQKTGAKTQQYRESETGGAAYADMIERQQLAFNRAALKRIGSKADEASADVMIEAHNRIGNMFNRLAQRNSIQPQNQLVRDLRATVRGYFDKVGKGSRAPIVEKTIKEITDAIANKGAISGQQYQSLITRLREAGDGANADLMLVTRSLRKNLDDAMERSIAQNNPGDLGAWKVARNNWRDLTAIEDTLATGAGGTEGMINPTKLHQVTTQQGGKRAAAQGGKTDLAELAAHGKTLMKSIAPDSGTASRLIRRMGGAAGAGGATGGAIGGLLGGPFGAAIGTAGGMAAGPIMSALKSGITMSKPMQKYLGNTILKKPAPSILGDKPAGGLLRILEQEQASERAGKRRHSSGGHNVD